jgi:hypothetical protein
VLSFRAIRKIVTLTHCNFIVYQYQPCDWSRDLHSLIGAFSDRCPFPKNIHKVGSHPGIGTRSYGRGVGVEDAPDDSAVAEHVKTSSLHWPELHMSAQQRPMLRLKIGQN